MWQTILPEIVFFRSLVPGFGWRTMPYRELWDIASLPRTRRWASNWVRLILILCGPAITKLSNRSIYRSTRLHEPVIFQDLNCCPAFSQLDFSLMDFDASLGFLGEGPCFGLLLFLFLSFLSRLGSSLSFGFSLRMLLGLCSLAFSPGLPGLLGASSPCLLGALAIFHLPF